MKKRVFRRRLCKEFSFEASHELKGMPEGHKCARNHGHSYKITVELESMELDSAGMILDAGVFALIRDKYDHRLLNTVMEKNPTAENIAEQIFNDTNDIIREASAMDEVFVTRVRVHETATCWAEVTWEEEDVAVG